MVASAAGTSLLRALEDIHVGIGVFVLQDADHAVSHFRDRDIVIAAMPTGNVGTLPLHRSFRQSRRYLAAFHGSRVQYVPDAEGKEGFWRNPLHEVLFISGAGRSEIITSEDSGGLCAASGLAADTNAAELDRRSLFEDAIFCILARGGPAYPGASLPAGGQRLLEVMSADCIPVLLSNTAVLPFEGVVDYEDFTLKLPESWASGRLWAILAAIAPREVQRLQQRVRNAWFRFSGDLARFEAVVAELVSRLPEQVDVTAATPWSVSAAVPTTNAPTVFWTPTQGLFSVHDNEGRQVGPFLEAGVVPDPPEEQSWTPDLLLRRIIGTNLAASPVDVSVCATAESAKTESKKTENHEAGRLPVQAAVCEPRVMEYNSSQQFASSIPVVITLCDEPAVEGRGKSLSVQLRQLSVLFKSMALFSALSIRVAIVSASEATYRAAVDIIRSWPASFCERLTFTRHDFVYGLRERSSNLKSVLDKCSLQRLLLPEVLMHDDRVIALDPDVLFMVPVDELWSHFQHFGPRQVAGLSAEIFGVNSHVLPRLRNGVHDGVALYSLDRWRTHFPKFFDLVGAYFQQYNESLAQPALDLINVWLANHPEAHYELPCTWNVRSSMCALNWQEACQRWEKEGALAIHGSTSQLAKERHSPWDHIFSVFEDHNLTTNSVETLLSCLRKGVKASLRRFSASMCRVTLSSLYQVAFLRGVTRAVTSRPDGKCSGQSCMPRSCEGKWCRIGRLVGSNCFDPDCLVTGGANCSGVCCGSHFVMHPRVCIDDFDSSCLVNPDIQQEESPPLLPEDTPVRWCRFGSADRRARLCCEPTCVRCGGEFCRGRCCGGRIRSSGQLCETEFDMACTLPQGAVLEQRSLAPPSPGDSNVTIGIPPPPPFVDVQRWEPIYWCRKGVKSADRKYCCKSNCMTCNTPDCVGDCCGTVMDRSGDICKDDSSTECLMPSNETMEAWKDAGGDLEHVQVAFSSNVDMFFGLLSSMVSLSIHLSQPQKCTIHLIVNHSDHYAARRLVTRFRSVLRATQPVPGVTLQALRSPSDQTQGLTNMCPSGRNELVCPENMARFYLHKYLPDVKRVIWLDVDTLVQADTRELYKMHMNFALAATLDWNYPYLSDILFVADYRVRTVVEMGTRQGMFNAGVMVLDLDLWRRLNIPEKLEAWMESHRERSLLRVGITQPVLNLVFLDQYDLIESAWNVQSVGEVGDAYGFGPSAKILHWSGGTKPWHRLGRNKLLPWSRNTMLKIYESCMPCAAETPRADSE
eukprot:TRINITY_DN36434_c0_g1_i1.p1 TRINITY_DN36434_c0_g1~~TRINITY_DN36434_c0_g1_i1.p1  ORF type:complete len:1416 (-),score=212.89 TRINITY_DN36434_c0_g1_i1:185-3967(-)